jgi:hypothetical protein
VGEIESSSAQAWFCVSVVLRKRGFCASVVLRKRGFPQARFSASAVFLKRGFPQAWFSSSVVFLKRGSAQAWFLRKPGFRLQPDDAAGRAIDAHAAGASAGAVRT